MNKKFLSAILFGALAVTSTGSFVSCKDYDDDIDNLQTQINGLASAKDLSDKVSTLQSAISSAQTAAEAKAAAAQVVADAAKAAADKAGADAADVKKALDAAVADLEAKGATKEELEAAKAVAAEAAAAAQKAGEDAAAAVKEVEAKLDAAVEAADAKVAEAAAAAAAAQKAVDELAAGAASQADLDAVKAAAAAAQAAADKAQATADEAKAAAAENKAALADAATKAEVAAVAAEVAANAAAIEAKADAETVEALAARVKALEEAIPGLDNEEAVKALAALATTLKDDVEGMATKLGVISKRLTSVVFAPKSYINGIEAIKFINLRYNDWSTDPKRWLANGATNWVDGWKWAPKQVEDFGAEVTYMVSPDGVTEKGIKMDELKFVLNDAKNTRAGVAAAKDVELTFLKEDLEVKNGKLHGYVKKTFKNNKDRLPEASEHINPVYYQDEAGNWYLHHYDALSTPKEESLIVASLKATIADDLKTEEEKGQEVAVYSDWTRVNETTGTPFIHRASAYGWGHYNLYSATYLDGKFNNTEDLEPTDPNYFEHKDYRAPKSIIKGNDNKYGPDAVYTYESTWYGYVVPAVYNQPLNLLDLVTVCVDHKELINDYARYGLAFEFNLMDYIVLNQNATKDADKTNQKDFATLEGTILTSRAENGLTNNKNALAHTPIIQAVLKDTKNNAVVDVQYIKIKWVEKAQETNPWDTPFEKPAPFMCSVPELNGQGDPTGNLIEDYRVWITEDEMNDFCSRIFDGGIKVDDFKHQYSNTSDIYLGELTDEVKADLMKTLDNNQNSGNIVIDGWKVYTSIGHAYWRSDAGYGQQTDNILLNYTFINPRKDQNWNGVEEKWEAAKAEDNFSKDGFFWFTSEDGANRIFVPVKINVKKGQTVAAVEKEPAQWNTAKDVRIINPQLRSNETYGLEGTEGCVTVTMIGKLQAGYYKNVPNSSLKPMPKTIKELAQHVDYNGNVDKTYLSEPYNVVSDIVFDAARIGNLPLRQVTVGNQKKNCNWYLSDDRKELHNAWLKNNDWNNPDWQYDLVAAVIDEDGNIYLTDKDSESLGEEYDPEAYEPNEASLLLVGVDVPVKLVGSNCEESDVDYYAVNFLKPLKFVAGDSKSVYDIKNGGSSAIINLNNIYLQENFGMESNKIYILPEPALPEKPVKPVMEDYTDGKEGADYDVAVLDFKEDSTYYVKTLLPAYSKELKAYEAAKKQIELSAELRGWYGVNGFLPNLKKAKTDILTGKFDTYLIDITLPGSTEQDKMPKYDLRFVDIDGEPVDIDENNIDETLIAKIAGIRFDNLSGNAIQQDINIEIPVSVDTKWQKASSLNGVIKITIHQTAIK